MERKVIPNADDFNQLASYVDQMKFLTGILVQKKRKKIARKYFPMLPHGYILIIKDLLKMSIQIIVR